MAQVTDAEKLARIRIGLAAFDRLEISIQVLVDNVRWALDQEAPSEADIEDATQEAWKIFAASRKTAGR